MNERDGTPFFVTGGTLRTDAPCYVERDADRDLTEGLLSREYCYVLDARQVGKSSLMVRAADRLRQAGRKVAVLDLSGIGQNLTPEQWYGGLLIGLGEQLGQAKELDVFWRERVDLGPMQRWFQALEHVILPAVPNEVAIFMDEIDAASSLPFPSDEFFAGIRQCYNLRTRNPDWERVTFCLIGVGTPGDLIRDPNMTPFNIGRRVAMRDFSFDDAVPLAEGLQAEKFDGKAALKRVLYWTGGHPYLTQRLCASVVPSGRSPRAEVDAACRRAFFSASARDLDDNLVLIRNRVLGSGPEAGGSLDLYQRILTNAGPVADEHDNPYSEALKLCGLVRVEGGHLRVRNRVYRAVFDKAWIRSNLPDSALRAQLSEARSLFLRTSFYGVGGVMAVGMLALFTTRMANERADILKSLEQAEFIAQRQAMLAQIERDNATEAAEEAKRSEQSEIKSAVDAKRSAAEAEAARRRADLAHSEAAAQSRRYARLLYLANARMIQSEWNSGNVLRSAQILDEIAMEADHGGFESRYWRAMIRAPRLLARMPPGPIASISANQGEVRAMNLRGQFWSSQSGGRPGSESIVVAAGSAASGDTFWVLQSDGTLKHKSRDGALLREWPGFESYSMILTEPSGTWIFVAGKAGLRGLDISADKWHTISSRPATAAAAQGPIVALGDGEGKTIVVDARDGRLLLEQRTHDEPIVEVAMSPDGDHVAAADTLGSVRVWSLRNRTPAGPQLVHARHASRLKFSPDGTLLASGDASGLLRVWNWRKGVLMQSFVSAGSVVTALAWQGSGRLLAGTVRGEIVSCEINTVARSYAVQEVPADVARLLNSHAAPSNALASGPKFTVVRHAQAPGNATLRFRRGDVDLKGHSDIVLCASVIDANRVVTGSRDRTLRIWDVSTGVTAMTLRLPGQPVAVAWDDSAGRLAVRLADGEVVTWKVDA